MLAVLLVLVSAGTATAQIANAGIRRKLVAEPVAPDSVDVVRLEHKSFWRASAETVGFNLALWSFDRYVLKGHYAYISWNTIKENFKHGFEWDNDHLNTNLFAHPYNGSLFYNAGRSNGYNFWQSELFAIGGSAMWEMFMEREYPSTNDIIATPIGGAAIGEVLYRTSDLLLDDRSVGGERFGRELAAFIVSPMRGFTRVVTGRAWERRVTSGRRFGVPPVSVEIALGNRYISLINNDEGSRFGLAAAVHIEYGNRIESSDQPYDWFSFYVEGNAIKTQPLLSRMAIIGRLFSRQVVANDRFNLSLGMYQHFDFFDSDTIKVSEVNDRTWPCTIPYKLGVPASAGFGAMGAYNPAPQWRLGGYLHLNGILLGGILTDFYREYNRNYNWGSGFSIKSGIHCGFKNDLISFSIANQFYWMYTWNGYDPNYDWSLTPEGKPVNIPGDSSKARFNHLEIQVNYRLCKDLYISGGIDLYSRQTYYDGMTITDGNNVTYFPTIESDQFGAHLLLTYRL